MRWKHFVVVLVRYVFALVCACLSVCVCVCVCARMTVPHCVFQQTTRSRSRKVEAETEVTELT